MPPSSRKELTEADVPPLPPKDLPPAEREQLMKARRKVQEQLREQLRGHRDRSERKRPEVKVATTQREKLRALKAPEIAVAAIEAAEVPITYAQMQPLIRMLDQVRDKMAMLHGTECDEFDKEYAECLSIHAMSLLASKLHESWQLQPKYHSFAARIGDRTHRTVEPCPPCDCWCCVWLSGCCHAWTFRTRKCAMT